MKALSPFPSCISLRARRWAMGIGFAGGVLFSFNAVAQLSPPGLEGAKLVTWGAVGFSQRLGNKWLTTVYAGGSGQSDLDNYSTLKKPAIFVINQETLYQFNNTWSLAACTSLRFQELYQDEKPFSPTDPSWRKEIRYYLRLFYRKQTDKLNWSYSFRPELRKFYDTHGDQWTSPAQLRFRFKGQLNIPINESKSNIIVLANEVLFATNESSQHQWSSVNFTEDRLSTYFRHVFKKPALFFDIGLMNQLWKDQDKKAHITTYMSFDFLFINPFGVKKKSS